MSTNNESKDPTTRVEQTHTVSGEQIAEQAYLLYLARGAEDGHDLDDWLEAERQLREQSRSSTAS